MFFFVLVDQLKIQRNLQDRKQLCQSQVDFFPGKGRQVVLRKRLVFATNAKTMDRRMPIKIIRPTAIFKSADEKLLSRVLGKFDIRLFFWRKKESDYFDDDLLLQVRFLNDSSISFMSDLGVQRKRC